MMPTFISVLQSMSEFPQIIWGRKRLMSFRKTIMRFVLKHPNWSLVKIYADKGISGTSTKHRVALNQMLADSRAGKIDLIITKSVSRLARNTVDCITMVRNLTELRNPVGVFFESECIFSLNEDTSMPLSFWRPLQKTSPVSEVAAWRFLLPSV